MSSSDLNNGDTQEATDARGAERRTFVCALCGSDELSVYYDERRVAGVMDRGEAEPEPWPNLHDEFVDIDPTTFNFSCTGCGEHNVAPMLRSAYTARQAARAAHAASPTTVPVTIGVIEQPAATGDGRYLGTCAVNGVLHHIDLIPVLPSERGLLALQAVTQRRLDDLMDVDEVRPDGTFATIAGSNGAAYVCAITPYCT